MGETTTNAIVKFTPMIRMIAVKLASKLPRDILIDDLLHEGVIALITAVRQCKDKDERFTAYAYQRVQGAMLDSLRAMDNAPRSIRQQAGEANAVAFSLGQRLGRRPFESEIAAAMGIELSEYQRLLFDVFAAKLLYFDPDEDQYSEVLGVIADGHDPEGKVSRRQLIEAMDWAIEALPEQLHRVVVGIYKVGMPAKQLAEELSLSPGRISQLRKESLEKIRAELRRRGFIPE